MEALFLYNAPSKLFRFDGMTYTFLMLLLISGNLPRHLLARHVLLHVQSDDLLLHEPKVGYWKIISLRDPGRILMILHRILHIFQIPTGLHKYLQFLPTVLLLLLLVRSLKNIATFCCKMPIDSKALVERRTWRGTLFESVNLETLMSLLLFPSPVWVPLDRATTSRGTARPPGTTSPPRRISLPRLLRAAGGPEATGRCPRGAAE